MSDADAIIARLGLEPHPEGGHFREIYRDPADGDTRGAVTSIYFLLRAGEVSHWHRIDATEIWAYHAGAPLTLSIAPEGGDVATHRIGPNPEQGQTPQAVVPPQAWQSARTLGTWTLVGCMVAPAFRFDGFELAPPEWHPKR